jgi:hypothetical protein
MLINFCKDMIFFGEKGKIVYRKSALYNGMRLIIYHNEIILFFTLLEQESHRGAVANL